MLTNGVFVATLKHWLCYVKFRVETQNVCMIVLGFSKLITLKPELQPLMTDDLFNRGYLFVWHLLSHRLSHTRLRQICK